MSITHMTIYENLTEFKGVRARAIRLQAQKPNSKTFFYYVANCSKYYMNIYNFFENMKFKLDYIINMKVITICCFVFMGFRIECIFLRFINSHALQ